MYQPEGAHMQVCKHIWTKIILWWTYFPSYLYIYVILFLWRHCVLRLTERPEQVTSPTLTLEWFFLGLSNLRMVISGSISGSSAHEMLTHPQQSMRRKPPNPQNLPGLWWNMFSYSNIKVLNVGTLLLFFSILSIVCFMYRQ